MKGATIHWVDAATAVDAEVRLYDNLFTDADPDAADKDFLECLNPDSLEVLTGLQGGAGLAAAADATPKAGPDGPGFQFMRLGYFCLDSKDSTAGPPGVQPQRQPEGQLQEVSQIKRSVPISGQTFFAQSIFRGFFRL